MKITEVKVELVDEGELRAYAKVTFDNCFAIEELQVIQKPAGLSVVMPSRKTYDGANFEIVFPVDAETRRAVEEAVLTEYINLARENLTAAR
jgi:stage V sporulation protein G